MRRRLFWSQIILFGLFNCTLVLTILQFFGDKNPLKVLDSKRPQYNNVEEYDPALLRLNSLHKVEKYCDSLYSSSCCPTTTAEFEETYSNLVSSVIRKRFYHGYSYYGFDNNYTARLFSLFTQTGYSAMVIPDDILKYPFAACSQQSIVMMEILKAKNFKTRKISFQGKIAGGHFCFEVFYKNSWHFYDPNMEPDNNVLSAYNRPGIAFLASHTDILTNAYRRYPKAEILDIFLNYSYGPVNKFPAPNALILHKATKFLSYSCWAFFLAAFVWVRRKYRRLAFQQNVGTNRIYLGNPELSSTYYPSMTPGM